MGMFLLSLLLWTVPASAESPPVPRTPQAVVDGIERALETLDADAYEFLVDWDFLFEFAPEHEWIAPDGWNYDQEIDAIRRMLSGEPTHDRDMPRRVTSIDVHFDPRGAWEETFEDPYGVARTWRRDFAARIVVEFDDGSSTSIHRRQVFTVVGRISEVDARLSAFRLLRWEEEESLGRFGSIRVRF